MKKVVVRLAMDDGVDVQQLLGSVLQHVPELYGAMIVSGDGGTILVGRDNADEAEKVAEFLAGDLMETHGLFLEGDEEGPFSPFGQGGR